MIAAFVTGLLLSFIGSMTPTGPIALIVLKFGMRGQKISALLVAAGGATAEAAYALLAYLGITFALTRYPLESSILRLISGIILIAFASLWIIRHRGNPVRQERDPIGTSFLLGLSIAGLNPTFLITWAGIIAFARGTGLIEGFQAAPAFACGVAAGPVLWFWILLLILNHHAKFISPQKIEKIERALPYVLLVIGGIILIRAILTLVR